MDHDHRHVNLINRGRVEHVYGAQNAPRTRSATPSMYDELASYWDTHLAATEAERSEFSSLVDDVTGGYRRCRTLDVGAGTGLALDLELTESVRCTAVDPSQAMLNELVRKHPLIARVEPMPFTEARNRRVFAGTKFDLVLALGGAASYLTDADLAALPQLGKGRFVLSVYAGGESPITRDLTDLELAAARERARSFAFQHGGQFERVGRFDVAVAGR